MYPHRIRLRQPWQTERASDSIRFTRGFNRPTGLDPQESLWLVIESTAASGTASLNNSLLGSVVADRQETSFDITPQLENRNNITIELNLADNEPPPVLGEVRLEVRLADTND